MAISSAICSSFKQELLQGKHSFESSGGHTFKIALFTSSASLGAATTDYSTSATTGANVWLEKKDVTYLQEYISSTESAKRGQPKYYAMFGGGTGETDTTSGRIAFAPVPNTTYRFRVHFNKMPDLLENDDTNYISMNFPNGLLYCCLSEAYGYLKGPVDMLTLYENKYKQEVQKFAIEQTGRRRRDDYTDGTVRFKIDSTSP